MKAPGLLKSPISGGATKDTCAHWDALAQSLEAYLQGGAEDEDAGAGPAPLDVHLGTPVAPPPPPPSRVGLCWTGVSRVIAWGGRAAGKGGGTWHVWGMCMCGMCGGCACVACVGDLACVRDVHVWHVWGMCMCGGCAGSMLSS